MGDEDKREESDQTQPMSAADGDDTAVSPDPLAPESPRSVAPESPESPESPELATADETSVMPPAAWAGRAEVPPAVGGLRDSAPYPTVADAPPPAPRTWWTPVLLGLLALGLVAIIVLAAWLMTRDTGPAPGPAPTATPTPTTTPPATTTRPAPSPTPSPQPELVEVPVLVGRTQEQAVAELDRLGLSYRFEYRRSTSEEGTVIEARPPAGQNVAPRTTVTLVISLGQTESPTPTGTPEDDD